ncbi:MAG: M23 family metallopeptidase [Ruminococcaceae bacterium]|nr:M23 family metallopeptidase [Oscillospiraceae bacterium]
MLAPYKNKFRVSQQYKGTAHDGLDIVGVDSKNVYSTVDGVVEKAGWENALNHKQGFGLYVRIKQNGSVDKYYFGHLSKICVKAGDKVSVGTLLGVEGSTGRSTGSHCHYCVRGNGSRSQIRDICAISGIPNAIGTYESDLGKNVKPNVIYRVRTNGKWLPSVTNLEDYAGINGRAITDIAIKVTSGTVKYRVHIKGGCWLPYVTGFNIYDGNNGYAGNGKPIDAIEVIYEGDKTAYYRVSPVGKNYFDWQRDNQVGGGLDGYAGLFGKTIDKVQIEIK